MARWTSRITRTAEVDPRTLVPNPHNFRRHPKQQLEALDGVLSQVGWVQNIIVNETTGNIVDGHARVEMAISMKETLVPVVYVNLTEHEERLVLAAFDPISALAETDRAALDDLLASVSADGALGDMLDDLAGGVDTAEFPDLPDGAKSDVGVMTLSVTQEQRDIIESAMNAARRLVKDEGGNGNGAALAYVCEAFVG